MAEKFNSNEVKSKMSEIEGHFETFAKTLKDINTTVNDLVNNGPDSAIFGEVGSALLNTWNYNASTFGDFHSNFQNWTEVVSVIAANNAQFVVTAESIYRSNGGNLDGVQNSRASFAANPTASDYYKNLVADEPETEGGVWKSFEDAAAAGFPNIRNYREFMRGGDDKEKYGTYQNYLNAMYEKYVGNGDSSTDGNSTPVGNTSNLKVGDAVSAGVLGEFVYQGIVQRGDMSQEQIFSKDGKLFYYDNGEMKPVTKQVITDITDSGTTYDYSTQATMDDLGKKTLYFQNSSGKYDGANANKTYTTSVDTDGSSLPVTGYSITATDYKTWDRNNYEGKGTTILIPDENYVYSYNSASATSAKDMVITSIIDVRNNIAQEATEMQTYLDLNRNTLTQAQITELESQISTRNTLASQMGKDVQFGAWVEDGVIGDWNTAWSYGDSYDKAMEAVHGYESTLSTFKSIDEIVVK